MRVCCEGVVMRVRWWGRKAGARRCKERWEGAATGEGGGRWSGVGAHHDPEAIEVGGGRAERVRLVRARVRAGVGTTIRGWDEG